MGIMVGIGEDIKDVLQELGTPIVIHKIDGSTITGEAIDYEHFYEASTEFRRQFAYTVDFQYDTEVAQGDLISFDSKYFLVITLRNNLFEQEYVDKSSYVIQCNTLGRLSKKTKVRDGNTYQTTVSWTTLHDNVYAVQAEREPVLEGQEAMGFVNNEFTLYTFAYTDIVEECRWYPDVTDLTEFYNVMTVSKYRFDGILVCRLDEDSRE